MSSMFRPHNRDIPEYLQHWLSIKITNFTISPHLTNLVQNVKALGFITYLRWSLHNTYCYVLGVASPFSL